MEVMSELLLKQQQKTIESSCCGDIAVATVPTPPEGSAGEKRGTLNSLLVGHFLFHLTSNLANCLLDRVSCLGSYWEPAALRASVRLRLGQSQDFVKMVPWGS